MMNNIILFHGYHGAGSRYEHSPQVIYLVPLDFQVPSPFEYLRISQNHPFALLLYGLIRRRAICFLFIHLNIVNIFIQYKSYRNRPCIAIVIRFLKMHTLYLMLSIIYLLYTLRSRNVFVIYAISCVRKSSTNAIISNNNNDNLTFTFYLFVFLFYTNVSVNRCAHCCSDR